MFKNGVVRVGNADLFVYFHLDIHCQFTILFSSILVFWVLVVVFFMVFSVGFMVKLFFNLITQFGVYVYVVPAVLGLFILVFLLFVIGVGLSFYCYYLVGNVYEWVGMGNFVEIVFFGEMVDIHFWCILGVIFLWMVFNVIFYVVIGLGLVLLFNWWGFKGWGWYWVLFIFFWVVFSYIIVLMWCFMFLG